MGDHTVFLSTFLLVPRDGVVGGDAIEVVGTPGGTASAAGDAVHPKAAGAGAAMLSSMIA